MHPSVRYPALKIRYYHLFFPMLQAERNGYSSLKDASLKCEIVKHGLGLSHPVTK